MVVNENAMSNVNGGSARGNGAATPARSPSPESAGEEVKKALEKFFYVGLRNKPLRLICYAVPTVHWIPVPYPPGREKIMTHEYVYHLDVFLSGGRLDIKVHKLMNLPGCQEPFETFSLSLKTWGELFEWLAKFIEKEYVTIVEVEKTIRETIWVDKRW